MKVDLAQCINKGMQRDYSMDKSSQEFAYENKNIRITTTGNNSFLSVSNEKSTIPMRMNIELPDSKLAYYNLNITRSDDGAFNGIGSISQASILFSKPLAMDASFNLHITTSFLNDDKDIELIVNKGQQEVNLEEYINNPIIGKVLSLRIWEYPNSVVFPVWIDHENTPYASNIGTVLGSTTIGNKVVIFNKYDDGTDAIIVGEPDSEYNNFNCTYLYQGDLNFNIDNPIECITSYEADDIQKVYWVDGVNQPRVINIINQNDDGEDIRYPRNTSFDFVPPIPSNIDVTIEKLHDGAGVFPSGIIQYYITYYKKFGPETNSVYQSPLYYISPSNRGGQADETQTCSFKLTITPKSNEFDYVRVYSLIRTSYNAEPIISIVGDINIKSSDNLKTVTITDTNVSNTPVASTDIMFLGGNTITASTIEQKDNTLFLGNISSKKEDIVSEIKKVTNKGKLQFCIKRSFVESSNNQYYPYAPEMDSSSINKTTFKYLEWYRFGLQVQLPTGEWSSTVHLGDFQNNILPNQYVEKVPIYPSIKEEELIDEDSDEPTTKQEQYLTGIQFEMSSELIEILANNSISNWRLVVAQHDANTRTVKAQGLVLPTIFNLEQRSKGTCYASPLWTLNTCLYGKHLMNIDPSGNTIPTLPREEINIDLNAHSHINYVNNHYDENNKSLTQLSSVVDYVSEETSTSDGYYLSHIQPIIKINRVYSDGLDKYRITIKLGIKNYDDPNTEIFGYVKYFVGDYTKYYSALYGNRRETLKTISEYLRMITWDEFLIKVQDAFKYHFKSDDGNLIVNLSDITGCTKSTKVFNPGEIPSGDELRDDYGVKPANDITITLNTYVRKATTTFESELIKTYSNDYFLDANTCNFLSPDLENVQGSTKFRIIGSADITNSISDYEIKVKDNVLDGVYYTYAKHMLNNYKSSTTENSEVFNTGIKSFPLWPFNNKLYNINYWHPGGPIIKNVVNENNANVDKYYFDLESKTFANMWVLGDNSYFDAINYGLAKEYTKIDNSSSIINGGIYKADYENLLVSKSDKNFAIPNSKEGVNETTPIEVISSYIDNKDIALIDRKPSTTTVKHSTASHGVFQLGKAHNLPNILPNYGNNILGNATIYNECYPLGKVNINNIWSSMDTDLYKDVTLDISKYLNINFTNAKLSLTQEGNDVVLNLTHNLHDLNIKITYFDNRYNVKNEDGEEIISFGGYIGLSNSTISTVYNSILVDIDYNVEDNTYSYNEVLLVISSASMEYYGKPVGILLSGIHKSENSNEFNVNRLEILNGDSLYKCVLKIEDTEYILDEFDYWSVLAVPSLTYYSKIIPTSSKLHIGEFYVDYDANSFMGGKGDNAIELNTFIPISGDYPQITKDGTVTGYGLEGDTYYQRWDYLRIYPTSDTDVNKPIDALSMMVETYKNLDGDYRKLRGRLDTINLTVNNTNTTINEVYSQPNNYITSTVLDEKFDDSTHPTMYTWSLTKQPLAEVDNWTRINLISANKLDGDKGNLNKIKRWNNSLFAFQDKAIAIINFNQQTTLSTSNGVPVEIANSGKVSGHYYLTTTQGCKNKWSIAESPYGLYFIDSYNKSINVLGDGIKSLSSYHLFDDWIRENECGVSWLPKDATGFKSFYDPIHKEVYFINKDTALCYNEILGQFTSFYDYQNTNTMVNIGNHIYSIYDDANDYTSGSKIYLMFEGNDYCKLYGTQRDYYMTYKVNKDPFIDKTWTNIEYRADIFNDGNTSKDNANKIATETFDTLKVWNEYQSGTSNLMQGKYPNAKAKFRVWRADIPRDTKEGRSLNRIRNPWVMLELRKSSNTHKRMEFHDLLVKYLS